MPAASRRRVVTTRRGKQVRDLDELLASAPWWVVRVRWTRFGLWSVYGGPAFAVRYRVAQHAELGPVSTVVAYPCATAAESHTVRAEVDLRYVTARRPVRAAA